MPVLYPDGYGRSHVTLAELDAKHGPKMHPTFRTQLFAYLASKGGQMGIGGGWRSTQPDKPGFAPDGKSFHQDQRFASGIVGYCAVDLVARNGTSVHRAPTWAETADAPACLLHTFIAGEPWHIQPINIRGWQSWVNAGRPDPTQPLPPPKPTPPAAPLPGGTDVFYPIQPTRVSDTRVWPGKVNAGVDARFGLDPKLFHAAPVAVAINVAVAEPEAGGYLTVWPAGRPRPDTSVVNYDRGDAARNGAVIVATVDDAIMIHSSARAHVIVDVTGYWTAK